MATSAQRALSAADDPTEIWLRMRSRHTMDPVAYERTIAAMDFLVAMRNELAQHFLEQFDIWEPDACGDADRYLEQSYEEIERHMVELTAWARHMDGTRAHSARAGRERGAARQRRSRWGARSGTGERRCGRSSK